jgi:hypothetical protein
MKFLTMDARRKGEFSLHRSFTYFKSILNHRLDWNIYFDPPLTRLFIIQTHPSLKFNCFYPKKFAKSRLRKNHEGVKCFFLHCLLLDSLAFYNNLN